MNAYHDHLDRCAQCREHPFALCAEGAAALRKEALRPFTGPTAAGCAGCTETTHPCDDCPAVGAAGVRR